jgi:NAD(P)H-hydrate epimerase
MIVLGPGLGQSDWAINLWSMVMSHPRCQQALPLVVDADGLNILANMPRIYPHWVITPHPGEAARLLQTTTQAIQQDRIAAVQALNQRYGGVSVLKGAGTLIATPDSPLALCDKGNPGMATAGMGDVLSGVIGGLIAQGIPIADAAKLGVYLHAYAGDLAAKEGERGLLALDLMAPLRYVINHPL